MLIILLVFRNLFGVECDFFGSDGCGIPTVRWSEVRILRQATSGSSASKAVEASVKRPVGSAYIWGIILDVPPHIDIVEEVSKHLSAII
jgi:hypothetical protein